MRYILENEIMTVEIESFGAEVKSVLRKEDKRQYMWHGDAKYWGRTSPVLFPFVGSVKNKEYRYEGKTYSMGQHGFARDMEFQLEKQGDREIWFVLASTEETLEKYPFAFRLYVGYRLEENQLTVLWKVENCDTKKMYFSIGAHPAFLCPIHGEGDKVGYGLHFDGLEQELHHHGHTNTGMAVMADKVLPLNHGTALLTADFFDECSYMVEGKQTKEVALLDKSGEPYVTVDFDTPLFALWSPEGKNAPFVCIEPWYGRCDAEDFEGSLEERPFENVLEKGGMFTADYRICFS